MTSGGCGRILELLRESPDAGGTRRSTRRLAERSSTREAKPRSERK
jgi:hypothetical protein